MKPALIQPLLAAIVREAGLVHPTWVQKKMNLENANSAHLAVRGRLMRMDSIRPAVFRPKVVPRSYTRLYST